MGVFGWLRGAPVCVRRPHVIGLATGLCVIGVLGVSAGPASALPSGGAVTAWGVGTSDALGNGSNTNSSTPVQVSDSRGSNPRLSPRRSRSGCRRACVAAQGFCWDYARADESARWRKARVSSR